MRASRSDTAPAIDRPVHRSEARARASRHLRALAEWAVLRYHATDAALRRARRGASGALASPSRICLFGSVGDPRVHSVPRLGDLIARNAVIRLVAERYPDAAICMVAPRWIARPFREFLLRHSYIDELIECPEAEASARRWATFIREMRRRRFELCVIDLNSAVRAIHGYLCGIDQRMGIATGSRDDRFLTRPVILRPATGTRVDLWEFVRAYAVALGLPSRGDSVRRPHFPFEPCEIPGHSRHASRGPLAAVHPGGNRAWNRRWPIDRFQEICLRLCVERDATIYLVGTEDEHPENQCVLSYVRARCPDACISDVSGGTLNDTANLLDACSLFIGNDSAPMHMAAALCKPVVALFGPAGPELWRRMYSGVVLSKGYACQNDLRFSMRRQAEQRYSCVEFECPYAYDPQRPAYPKCLVDIDVEEVWSAIAACLDGESREAQRCPDQRATVLRGCVEARG